MIRLIKFAAFICAILALSCHQKQLNSENPGTSADSIKTAQVEESESTFANEQPVLFYNQKIGKRLYDQYCAICHGSGGEGDGFNAYNLDLKPGDLTGVDYLETVTDEWLFEAISRGGRGVKRSVLMPSYELTLSKAQIEAIVAYLRVLGERRSERVE